MKGNYNDAAASLTNLHVRIFQDKNVSCKIQSALGELVNERFRLVLEELELGEWTFDSECPWAVYLVKCMLTVSDRVFTVERKNTSRTPFPRPGRKRPCTNGHERDRHWSGKRPCQFCR